MPLHKKVSSRHFNIYTSTNQSQKRVYKFLVLRYDKEFFPCKGPSSTVLKKRVALIVLKRLQARNTAIALSIGWIGWPALTLLFCFGKFSWSGLH